MTKINRLSIYSKLLLLIFFSTTSFILLFLYLFYYTLKQEKEVYTMTQKQLNDEVNSLMKLNSESHYSTLIDVTYWDALVDFTQTKDQKWFDKHVGNIINMYFVEYIGIYDLQGNEIGKKYKPELKHPIRFINKPLLNYVYQKRTTKFYVKLPEGYAEVFMATIHPGNDPTKMKSKPSGFFVMARLLNQEYINRLEEISTSKVSFSYLEKEKLFYDNFIKGIYTLKSWNGEKIGVLAFERKFFVNFKATERILAIILIFFILFLIVYVFFLRRWVSTPLYLITQILEAGNKKAIKRLKSSPGEFSKIGNLFEETFSQRKQLEKAKAKAEESDQLKTAFLTNLSHEIRTPMNAIIGFSELLKENGLEESEKQNYIKIINKSGVNLVSIIDDLIEMSKIDANQIRPNISSVDLESCMQELYKSIAITISKDKNIDFKWIEANPPITSKVLLDETKFKQILTNLLTNAIKFTNQGFVEFGYHLNSEKLQIDFFVRDSGLGIAQDHQPFIFDRFRRVDNDYSIKEGGLGLGLAITKAYVQLLDGTIELESELDQGSLFTFSIPLVYATESTDTGKVSEDSKDHPIDKSITVLVAEDDNINYLLIENLLIRKDFNVIRAKDGIEAVELYQKYPQIDLVLMDIKMPRMGGYEAFEKIKEINAELPIIAQTAFSSSEEIEKINTFGFSGYITKPIDKATLYDLISEILKHY
ncbi:response regulator [Flavobacterium luminosum]|uniref:histidine kinase n=1 Tax=Flavobacterium luminosum TaxID=2949086 RepID=A0ABT0TLR0_9FLAO|nr:response regulator [Flavobacterium sp. HXWNR70]MCL9808430.1 response regulator [Flavobacterium sp. HXWNR70]